MQFYGAVLKNSFFAGVLVQSGNNTTYYVHNYAGFPQSACLFRE